MLRVEHAVLDEPRERVCRVLFEPRQRRSQAEAVTPGVHVGEHARQAVAAQPGGEQDLQITHADFFVVAAARVGVKGRAARAVDADVVPGFVQRGMDGCVSAYVETMGYEACFRIAEVGSGYGIGICDSQDVYTIRG